MNKKTISGVFLLLLILVFNSCTDDPLQVGFELLPGTDLLETNADTFSVRGYTVKGAAYYSNSYSNIQNSSIGHVIDPIFGESWAEATMQLNYGESNFYYKPNASPNVLSNTYKSCKLYLKINKEVTFGGEGGFDLLVYPLNKQINHTNRTDYVIKSEDFDLDSLISISTEHNVYISHSNITNIDSNSYYLVVELNENYGLSLMDTNLYSTGGTYLTDFPGFYIRANATNGVGSIESINFSSSQLILEYDREFLYKDKDGNDSIVTKTKYGTFAVSNFQSLYRHQSNYSPEGPFGSFLGDTVNASDQIYLQALGGVRGLIEIPGLEEMREKLADSIGINYAELVLPVNTDLCDTTGFYLPWRISLQNFYPGTVYSDPVVDDNPSYFSGLGATVYTTGYLDPENMEYRVNITQYVHSVVNKGTYTNWLYIMPSKLNLNTFSELDYQTPSRAIIQTENGNKNAFLRIIYTNTSY